MPKVSSEHLAARREQIILAAMTCFTEKGFQATTMADVIKASELSAGAVYRYFTSKEDLITAIVQRVIDIFGRAHDELLAREPEASPVAVLGHLLHTVQQIAAEGSSTGDLRRTAFLTWGEALRDDRLRTIVSTAQLRIRARLEEAAERAVARGQLAPGTDPSAVATALHSLIVGWVVQCVLIEDLDVDRYLAGIAQLTSAPDRSV